MPVNASSPAAPAEQWRPTAADLPALALGVALAAAMLSFTFHTFETAGLSFTLRNIDQTKWLALAGAVLLAAGLIVLRRIEAAPSRISEFDVLLFLLLGWMAASLAWAPDPRYGTLAFVYGALAASLYVAVRLMRTNAADRVIHAMALAGLAGVMLSPLVSGDPQSQRGFGNTNFQIEFEAAMVAVGLAFWNAGPAWLRWLTRVVVVAGAVDVFVVMSPVAGGQRIQYVALLGVGLYSAFRFGRRWQFWTALAVAAAASGGVIAFVIHGASGGASNFGTAILTRLQNWTNSVGMALEHPVQGWGVGGYLHGFPDFRQFYLADFGFLGPAAEVNQFSQLGGEAHNDLLQVWVELGLLGVVIVLAMLAVLAVRLARLERGDPAVWYGGGLVALVALAMIEFPFQNPATMALAAILLAAVAGRGASVADDAAPAFRRTALAIVSVAAVVAIVAGWQARTEQRAQIEREHANAHHRAGDYAAAVVSLAQALDISDASPYLRAQLFPEMMIAAEQAGQAYTEEGIEAAYAMAVSAAPHSQLLLDFRIKYLAQVPPLGGRCGEANELIATYRDRFGLTIPNPFIAEAAYALHVNELDRAIAALALAKEFNASQAAVRDDPANVENNARNIYSLEVSVARRQRESPRAPVCATPQ